MFDRDGEDATATLMNRALKGTTMPRHHLTIRMASPSDQTVLLEVLEEARQWLVAKGIPQWTFPFTAAWVGSCLERQEFFVAKSDEVVVGVFRLLDSDTAIWGDRPGAAVYIHSLAVRRSWQGRRVGNDVVDWIEAYAARHQKTVLRLDCLADNTALCRHYETLGFVPGAIQEFRFGESLYRAQLFEKRLDTGSEPVLSLDKARLQLDTIHAFLTTSYWSPGISRELVETAISNSLTVGAFDRHNRQIGFARLVTDHATFGYLADVFVLEEHRGQGLARKMTQALLDVPEVKRFRRILLATRDAHRVYEKVGFQRLEDPTPLMQIVRPDVYREQ